MTTNDYSHLEDLSFDDFKRLAQDDTLSAHEKVGFPDEYREGRESPIFDDILRKLPNIEKTNQTILEIGPGCSELPRLLSDRAIANGSKLYFIDSAEMLEHLPQNESVHHLPGAFPDALSGIDTEYSTTFDVILAYSVIQYVFADSNIWRFLDECLMRLNEGGQLLLGDIPNISMRKRFFASNSGKRIHQEYTGTDQPPEVHFNVVEPGKMDDHVILGLIGRARAQSFQAWVVPQAPLLPMANRREDILIQRA